MNSTQRRLDVPLLNVPEHRAAKRSADVVIVGGGLAGSTAAAMLGRAGIEAVMVDPHPVYPPDFRCEKLDGSQVRVLRQTGLADAVLRVATHDKESWVARFGCLVDKRPGDQQGIHYDTMVNAIRGEIPGSVTVIHGKAIDVESSADRQIVRLSTGEEIAARLIVIANGLNTGIRERLGMRREVLSKCHSIMLGFDLLPIGRPAFEFPALTYYAERATDRTAYITLFPIGTTMRANLCVYREMDDPWLRQFRQNPQDTLYSVIPGLRRFTGEFEVPEVKIRPADLYITRDCVRPGIVLVGDAFATSCPAAGTGTGKVFTDVERLCNVHIPRWLATAGMGEQKIAAFYADPVKRASDTASAAKAYHVRSLSIEEGFSWRARRWGRFMARLGVGMLRQAHDTLATRGDRTSAVSDIGARRSA